MDCAICISYSAATRNDVRMMLIRLSWDTASRALKVAAQTWGDESQLYLKAAVRFASEFDSWGGFE
jgi:hypothetical protein